MAVNDKLGVGPALDGGGLRPGAGGSRPRCRMCGSMRGTVNRFFLMKSMQASLHAFGDVSDANGGVNVVHVASDGPVAATVNDVEHVP